MHINTLKSEKSKFCNILLFAKILTLCIVFLNTSHAEVKKNQNYVLLEKFKSWKVYRYKNDCFAITTTKSMRSYNAGIRTLPYLSYSRKGQNKYSLSFPPGYRIDNRKKSLLYTESSIHSLKCNIDQSTLWPYTGGEDRAILFNILRGQSFEIRTYSISGNTSLDIFCTDGLSESIKYMEEKCANDNI